MLDGPLAFSFAQYLVESSSREPFLHAFHRFFWRYRILYDLRAGRWCLACVCKYPGILLLTFGFPLPASIDRSMGWHFNITCSYYSSILVSFCQIYLNDRHAPRVPTWTAVAVDV